MTDIMREIKSRGINLSKRKGQCLLRDNEIMQRILDEAQVGEGDFIVDIGTGPGHTVPAFLERGAFYAGIELDSRCYAMAQERLADEERCVLLRGDILAGKQALNPEVMDALSARISAEKPQRVKLVANLPYSVATPVVMRFLLQDRIPLDLMAVMVQKEVACRFTARAGTDEYGAVSVIVAVTAEARMLFDVHPEAFFPKPKVRSSVVLMHPLGPGKRSLPDADLPAFERFIRGIFNFRKKAIVNCIDNAHLTGLTKQALDRLLNEAGCDPSVPLLQHSAEDLVRVFRAVPGGREPS